MSPLRNANRETLEAKRRISRHQRLSPDDLIRRRLVVRTDGREEWLPPVCDPSRMPVPAEVWIRLSTPDPQARSGPSEPAWDPGDWLRSAVDRWADRRLEVYFVSFDPAPLQAGFFDRVRLLSDRNLRWQTKLLTDGKNLTSTAVLDQVLRSKLDEVYVYVAGLGEPSANGRVLDAVKDLVDLRVARGQNLPKIICRLCPGSPGSSRCVTEITQWVKQAGVDRLEITDKETEEKRLWA